LSHYSIAGHHAEIGLTGIRIPDNLRLARRRQALLLGYDSPHSQATDAWVGVFRLTKHNELR
jgi:hypothetical protein